MATIADELGMETPVPARVPGWLWLSAGLAVIVAGFWPTFFGDPRSNDAAHTIHGVLATLWVVLLIAQSVLAAGGRHRLHRRLGWASLALVAALLAASLHMVWIETTGRDGFPPALRLSLVLLDIELLALFVALYAAGIVRRHRRAEHLRLMGSTVLVGMVPAIGRFLVIRLGLPGGLGAALAPSLWVVDAILVVAILIDLRRGRLAWPFPVVLAGFVVMEVTMPIAQSAAFAALARAVGAPV